MSTLDEIRARLDAHHMYTIDRADAEALLAVAVAAQALIDDVRADEFSLDPPEVALAAALDALPTGPRRHPDETTTTTTEAR